MDSTEQTEERVSANDTVIITENVLDQHYQYMIDPSGYKVYKRRWFLLFVIVVINFTNALVSIATATVSKTG